MSPSEMPPASDSQVKTEAAEEPVVTDEVIQNYDEEAAQVQVQVQEQAEPSSQPDDEALPPPPQLPPSYNVNPIIDPSHPSYHNTAAATAAPLRRGKWTPEESAYANRLILEFKSGTLPLPPNITLREFLSKLLRCDPMRITKKFEGDNSLRKVVYKRILADPEAVEGVRRDVGVLEKAFLERLEKTKMNSSQALADNALLASLKSFREENGSSDNNNVGNGGGEAVERDLIDLFCAGHAESEKESAAIAAVAYYGQGIATSDADMLKAARKRHHYTSHDAVGLLPSCSQQSTTSLQRDLLLHLSRMQALIQGQAISAAESSQDAALLTTNDDDGGPAPAKKFKTASPTTAYTANNHDDQYNYNLATANLLSIQRMILDNKHKLYDIEFRLAEEGQQSAETLNEERKREVTDSIHREIELLERQKMEMEREIQQQFKGNSCGVGVKEQDTITMDEES